MNQNTCRYCKSPVVENARFCQHCGKKTSSVKLSLSPAVIFSVCASATILGLVAYTLSPSLVGRAPSAGAKQTETKAAADTPYSERFDITALRQLVEKEPDNIQARKQFTDKIWEVIASGESVPQELVLELITQLSTILAAEPKDAPSLLVMANISFNQKVFDKSVQYYQRYLEIEPADFQSRSSYASALTFLGKFEDAIHELDSVMKAQPTYFQAQAYKTITLAQMGKIDEALKLGSKTLVLAPTEDAKSRFSQFLESLSTQKDLDPVTRAIQNNQVAGNKFVGSERTKDGTVKITLKGFPIDRMPPAMQDSFFAKLSSAAKEDATIKAIQLVDADTGAEMKKIIVP